MTEKEKLHNELYEALEFEIESGNLLKTENTDRGLITYTMTQNAVIKAQNRLILHQQEEILNLLNKKQDKS